MDEQQVMGNNGDHQQGQHNGMLNDDVEGKIFVGGLSWQTTEESMRFHFEKFGELSDIAIMIDKRTGQPRCVPMPMYCSLYCNYPSSNLTCHSHYATAEALASSL